MNPLLSPFKKQQPVSFPRRRESRGGNTQLNRPAPWIPAFAGMTSLLWLCLSGNSLLAATPAIDDRFCQQLVKHTPSADVAYQAGVDARGNAVVPADLEGNAALPLPDELTIPLTADLRRYLGISLSAIPFVAKDCCEVQPVLLTLRGDTVLFNGQPLTDAQQDNLAVLCLKPTK